MRARRFFCLLLAVILLAALLPQALAAGRNILMAP